MQVHRFSVEIDAPPPDIWEVFWYWGPDRPQPKLATITRVLPGDETGTGLVRTCTFRVPGWLLTGGRGQSWEWVTTATPYEGWHYDAIGRPPWSHAEGTIRLEDLGGGRTRVHFEERYEAFNPVIRVLLEKRIHQFLSRDNDAFFNHIVNGLAWHRERRARLEAVGEASEN
jgi:hypothetical protein